MPIETELKLQLPQTLQGFDSRLLLTRLQPSLRSKGTKKVLRNVYFDTAERDLAKRGIALRVREIGRKRIQTLKVPNGSALGLQSFRELEAELPNDQPSLAKVGDRALARELRQGIWPKLQPVFLTNFERTSWRLPYRESEIEVSLDRGSILAGDREEPIHELELELKGGNHIDLWGAAEELLDIVPFRLGHVTKAARGYALADAASPQPQKAAPVKLTDDDTVATAFEKIVAGCIAQMQANEAAMLATGAVEAIHQFRVALRRLRAIVGAYRELIDDTVHAAWSIDLRWAQRACGPARDLDVLVLETLSQMSSHLQHDEAFQRFLQVANEGRAVARREAIQALHNPRYAAMQLQLFQGLHDGAWRHALAGPILDAPVRDFAERLLQKRYKRLMKLGERWSELPDAELHRLRIFGKKLRYVSLAFSSLFKPKATKRFQDRLSDVQDCLGAVNDGAVGRQLVRHLAERAGAQGALEPNNLQRIQGMVVGWQTHAAHERIAECAEIWTTFAETKQFWRMRR
ncbi:CYTH and CHAD domain-containing protein [Dongia deserti]|uniref:CYTH and CHAD domain-containing protein n=1 Tax=Dongia deserti TaxID=2268030 RepID=UPI0013C50F8F|nr:CHAD domain-containing protein [Dongia deserti]